MKSSSRFGPPKVYAVTCRTGGPNVLRLAIDPDRIAVSMNLANASNPFDVKPITLATDLPPQRLSAYARLLLDILDGNATLSIRADEAEESWRIMDPVIDARSAGASPLQEYPAGSAGPH